MSRAEHTIRYKMKHLQQKTKKKIEKKILVFSYPCCRFRVMYCTALYSTVCVGYQTLLVLVLVSRWVQMGKIPNPDKCLLCCTACICAGAVSQHVTPKIFPQKNVCKDLQCFPANLISESVCVLFQLVWNWDFFHHNCCPWPTIIQRHSWEARLVLTRGLCQVQGALGKRTVNTSLVSVALCNHSICQKQNNLCAYAILIISYVFKFSLN